ncbi:MAG: peptidoglycan-binding protein, partial [Syntrophomonadaceae bacterium]|nr:peptidoglycan-binding protein [Syntrophomonadaceae bacterium]
TALQNSLNQHGCICATDGVFGSETLKAVKRFQRAAGLSVDGIVGPRTWQALGVQTSGSNTSVSRGAGRSGYTLTMVATGYCPCYKCNYPYGGKPTYMGDIVQHGIAAVDPGVIRMGSHLNIEGYGYAKASDQGNAITGNRIDLCFNSHAEALRWGIRTVTVTVL